KKRSSRCASVRALAGFRRPPRGRIRYTAEHRALLAVVGLGRACERAFVRDDRAELTRCDARDPLRTSASRRARMSSWETSKMYQCCGPFCSAVRLMPPIGAGRVTPALCGARVAPSQNEPQREHAEAVKWRRRLLAAGGGRARQRQGSERAGGICNRLATPS